MLSLAEQFSIELLRNSPTEAYRPLWSERDGKGYVLVFNPTCGAIITVLPALHDDGSPCAMRALKSGEEGYAFVTETDMKRAMELQGIVPPDMSDPAGKVYFRKRSPRTWTYLWKVRFMTAQGPQVKTLAKAQAVAPDVPENILADARNAIKESGDTWDAIVYIEHRDERAPLDEWTI